MRVSVAAVKTRVIKTRVIEDDAGLDLPEWGSLAASASRRHIFATPTWNKLWWESFGEGKTLAVLVFTEDRSDDAVALAALMGDRTEGGRRIRFLGGDDLTDYLGPVTGDADVLPGVADGLLDFLAARRDWDVFDAKCLPVPFGFAEPLVEAADRRGMDYTIEQDEMTVVLPLPGTFAEYLARLPGKKRHELRRKLRRFEAEHPGATLRRSDEQHVPEDLETFESLHRASEGEKGGFLTPERSRFFRRLAEEFGRDEILSLDLLESDGTPLAVNLSLVYEGVFYLYNSAYDSRFKALSPGLVIVARLIERCIEEGLSHFDFLRGTERYKFDLGGQPLPLHSVTIRGAG